MINAHNTIIMKCLYENHLKWPLDVTSTVRLKEFLALCVFIIKSITSMSTATELKCTCTLHDGTIHRKKISDMAQNGKNHGIK